MPEVLQHQTPTPRSYTEVTQERGGEYPRSHRDSISKKKDREDFLIAAYHIITHKKSSLFQHLLGISLYSRRIEYIKNVPKIGRQLTLMGILAKVISYDKKKTVIIPNDIELDDILREMQRTFEPDTIRVRPEPLPQEVKPEPLRGPGTLFGRPIVNEEILRILENIPTEAAIEEKEEPIIPVRRPKPSLSSVSEPVTKRVEKIVNFPKRPAPHQAPRRGDKPQHVGHRAWEIPHHIKEERAKKLPELPHIPEKKPSLPELPEFARREEALLWIQGQHALSQNYTKIKELKDDLALFAFIRPISPYILRVLISIKNSFQFASFQEIIQNAFEQEKIQTRMPPIAPQKVVLTPTVVVIPEIPKTLPDAVDTHGADIDITPEHEQTIKAIFELHRAGKYREFLEQIASLSLQVRHEIEQIRAAFSHPNIYYSIAYIAGAEFSQKENNLYVCHNWWTRIRRLPGVDSNLQTLLNLGKDANRMSVIERKIGNIGIRVPNNLREPWYGFDENHAVERPLIEVIQSLIKTAPGYKKDDEESTKKILKTIKQIMGLEVLETAE